MTLVEQLRRAARATLAELRADRIVWRMLRWERSSHDPVETGVADPPLVCVACRVDWPCDEWVRIDAEMERTAV